MPPVPFCYDLCSSINWKHLDSWAAITSFYLSLYFVYRSFLVQFMPVLTAKQNKNNQPKNPPLPLPTQNKLEPNKYHSENILK